MCWDLWLHNHIISFAQKNKKMNFSMKIYCLNDEQGKKSEKNYIFVWSPGTKETEKTTNNIETIIFSSSSSSFLLLLPVHLKVMICYWSRSSHKIQCLEYIPKRTIIIVEQIKKRKNEEIIKNNNLYAVVWRWYNWYSI